ncbi:MAG: ABC transporter ATP-binding protein [Spirochaetaceae bacterium]|nr:ABC transporter ATP-binding protein [Spirochaetaceae bacterium]
MKKDRVSVADLPLKAYWDLLARHVRPQMSRFSLLAALMLGSIGMRIFAPRIMRSFIDAAREGEAVRILVLMAAGFIGVAVAQQLISVAVTYLGESVAWTATNALRAELAEHALSLDMRFHSDHSPGELIERIDGDVGELAAFFSQFALNLAANALLLIGILAALYVEDWRAGIGFTVFAVGTILVLGRLRNLSVPHQKARREAEAVLYGFIEEQLAGTEDIRSSGAAGYTIRELFRLQRDILIHNRKGHFKRWIIENAMGLALTIGTLMTFAGGYWLYSGGLATIGTVYLFVQYINLLEEPLWAMTHQVDSFQTIGACVQRLAEFKALKSGIADGPGTGSWTRPLALGFEGVNFSYNGTDLVLRDLSFDLEPGKVLGLLGRTGSGKTTLSRLVFRLYDPTAGRITVNGADLRRSRISELRREIALVTQDVQLFRSSVRDNISFFDGSISDARILAAIEQLGLGEWFASLSAGLDTRLDSGGHSLSAGEAQLLAFTRVFLRDPGLVILDEASSRLDPATERTLERAVDRLLAGRTAIVIAHRLETVRRADDILILEDGAVCEHGGREELAADGSSTYRRLLGAGLQELLA